MPENEHPVADFPADRPARPEAPIDEDQSLNRVAAGSRPCARAAPARP
jgi:hypothetical protein